MRASPIILLIGMMLSGKTTVGRRLAQRLGWAFSDLDAEIVHRSGRNIEEWFAEGESAFRDLEADVLVQVLDSPGPKVIAAGGGAMERSANRVLARKHGFVVYLEATPETLADRIKGEGGRPLIDGAADPIDVLATLLAQRAHNYRAAGHYRLPVAGATPGELVQAIVQAYDAHVDD